MVLVDTAITHTDFSEKCLQRLPINNSAPVAAADFDPHDQTVVVVYANHQVWPLTQMLFGLCHGLEISSGLEIGHRACKSTK